MFTKSLNIDESINVMIYNDGRLCAECPPKPTLTQKTLLLLLKKKLKDLPVMQPGRYEFKYVKIGRWNAEGELTKIEE